MSGLQQIFLIFTYQPLRESADAWISWHTNQVMYKLGDENKSWQYNSVFNTSHFTINIFAQNNWHNIDQQIVFDFSYSCYLLVQFLCKR